MNRNFWFASLFTQVAHVFRFAKRVNKTSSASSSSSFPPWPKCKARKLRRATSDNVLNYMCDLLWQRRTRFNKGARRPSWQQHADVVTPMSKGNLLPIFELSVSGVFGLEKETAPKKWASPAAYVPWRWHTSKDVTFVWSSRLDALRAWPSTGALTRTRQKWTPLVQQTNTKRKREKNGKEKETRRQMRFHLCMNVNININVNIHGNIMMTIHIVSLKTACYMSPQLLVLSCIVREALCCDEW